MTGLQVTVLVIAVVAVVVVGVAMYWRGRRHLDHRGEDAVEDVTGNATEGGAGGEPSGEPDDEDESVFGGDIPVRSTELGLLKAMPEAVIVCEPAGRVRYAGEWAESFSIVEHGRIVVEEIDDIVRSVAAGHQPYDKEIRIPLDPARRSSRRGEPDGRGVQAGRMAPSDTLFLRVHASRISDELVAVFLSDVSEQRRFEAMRRDFVTNVSHELKTPAGAISLLAETIAGAADDPEAVRYFSDRIAKESDRLTELVYRLIDLQRAQSMSAIAPSGRISAADAVRKAIDENKVGAEAKHIAIHMTLCGHAVPLDGESATGASGNGGDGAGAAGNGVGGGTGTGSGLGTSSGTGNAGDGKAASAGTIPGCGEADVMVRADAESLVTAVKNLVENAIHYSPEHTTVVVDVARRDGKVVIRVIDQGIGIPAASLDRVFERFYRVDPARSRDTGGSGLGLSIVKHCVEECGGTVSVWSREGAGSTFTIELPFASREAGADAGADASAGADENGGAADSGVDKVGGASGDDDAADAGEVGDARADKAGENADVSENIEAGENATCSADELPDDASAAAAPNGLS